MRDEKVGLQLVRPVTLTHNFFRAKFLGNLKSYIQVRYS